MLGEYLLVLVLSHGGVVVVPQVYPSEEACKTAGDLWHTQTEKDTLIDNSYTCLYKYEQKEKANTRFALVSPKNEIVETYENWSLCNLVLTNFALLDNYTCKNLRSK